MSGSLVRFASVAVAALGLATFSLPSQAVVISSGASSYSFNWSYTSAAGLLSGNGTLAVSGFNSHFLTVGVTLNNTSGLASNRLTAFGFGIDPNAVATLLVDSPDGGLWAAWMTSIPGLAAIEVCAFGGPTCAGGGNGGIYGGNSDSFTLLLAGNWGNSVNIDPIGFKYQTGAGSFHFTANGGSVPAPGPLALFGFGLAALVFRRRVAAS